MNWTKWSSIAEIASSVAILVTLGYVAVEIRQNTMAMQASTREGVIQNEREGASFLIAYPELTSLLYKEDLTELEANRVHAFLLMFSRIRESNFRQHVSGALDEQTWLDLRTSLTDGPLISLNGRRWWLNAGQFYFDPDFTREVNENLPERPLENPVPGYFKPVQETARGK